MTLLVVSDIHYAAAEEKQRRDYELQTASQPWARALLWAHRHYIWKRDPFAHNHLLREFISAAGSPEIVVANGDYSCDTAFVGVSDAAALSSARECLHQLRQRFGNALLCTMGDHELGKFSLIGRRGGLRLTSWHAATRELGLQDFWKHDFGRHVLLGFNSTLAALPLFEPEALPEEVEAWRELRRQHMATLCHAFEQLEREQRVLLFGHDPTALPYLWQEPAIQQRVNQVALTVVGHLHSPLILWQSRLLAGMPHIRFLGSAIRRMTGALRQAKYWRPFKPRLCPALSGIELLKDGGYAQIDIDSENATAPRFSVRRLPWHCTCPNSEV